MNKSKSDKQGSTKPNRNRNFRKEDRNSSSQRGRSILGGSHCGKNDVEMHLKSTLITETSNINFALPQGMTHKLVDQSAEVAIPSVCSIGFLPAFGQCSNYDDPINYLAQQMMAYMRSQGHISQDYDQNDVMIQLQASAQYILYVAWLKRIVKYGYTYDRDNYYIPEVLALADNVDQESISANRDHLEMYINTCINRAGRLNIPTGLDFMELPTRYLAGIYCDDTGTRRQFYIFVPEMFMGFQLDATTNAGSVSKPYPIRCRDTLLTYEDIKSIGDSLWANLFIDETYFAAINGDIARAFPNLYQIPAFTPGQWVEVFDEPDVINQIRNARLYGKPYDGDELDLYGLYQDPSANCLYSTPKLKPIYSAGVYTSTVVNRIKAIINAPVQTVYASPGQSDTGIRFMMEATRFIPLVDKFTPEDGISFKSAGLIILTFMRIFTFKRPSGGQAQVLSYDISTFMIDGDAQYHGKIGVLSTFTNHPTVWLIASSGSPTYAIQYFNTVESILDKVGYVPQQTLVDYHFNSINSLYWLSGISGR